MTKTLKKKKFTQRQLEYAFTAGRKFSMNYHFSDLKKDVNFKENKKNPWQ